MVVNIKYRNRDQVSTKARSLRRHKCSDAAARLIEGLTRCLRREEVVQG